MHIAQMLKFPSTLERRGAHSSFTGELMDSHLGLMAQSSTLFRRYRVEDSALNQLVVNQITESVGDLLVNGLDDHQKSHSGENNKIIRTYLNLWEIHGFPVFSSLFATMQNYFKNDGLVPQSPLEGGLVSVPIEEVMAHVVEEARPELKEHFPKRGEQMSIMNPLWASLSYDTESGTAQLHFFKAFNEKEGVVLNIGPETIIENHSGTEFLDENQKLKDEDIFQLAGQTLYAIGACTNICYDGVWLTEEAAASLPDADLSGAYGYPFLRPTKPATQ